MSWWAFPSGSFLCLLTFISQVKSLTEVHPITLIFLRSVTTLAIITPVCTPSIYETKPNNTLYRAGFWRILWECFFVGRRLDIIKLINLVQIGIVRDQPPFPAGQSLQGFISNQLSTFSSGCQNPIILVFSSYLVFKQLSTLSKLSGCCQNPIVSLFNNLGPQAVVKLSSSCQNPILLVFFILGLQAIVTILFLLNIFFSKHLWSCSWYKSLSSSGCQFDTVKIFCLFKIFDLKAVVNISRSRSMF